MSTKYSLLPSDDNPPPSNFRNSIRSGDAALALDGDAVAALAAEQDAHVGVKRVEAAQRVYGRYSRWALFIGLGLASYIYSLDSSTTQAYLTFATSALGAHSLLSSVTVAQSLIIAVGKPVIAKVADISSRGNAFVGVLFFYVVGYIVIATAKGIGQLAGGIILYAIGYTNLQLLTQIIIADITTLKWRGLVSSMVSLPFLFNSFIGSNISTAVLEHLSWRWGYAMFAFLVPIALSPLIVTLLWAERKTKKLVAEDLAIARAAQESLSRIHSRAVSRATGGAYGAAGSSRPVSRVSHAHETVQVDDSHSPVHPVRQNVWATRWETFLRVAEQMDAVGLVLLGAAVSLILLPLTLSQASAGSWKSPGIITMLCIGVVSLFVFGWWDFNKASRPVLPKRFVFNRSVAGAALIGFFDFASYFLTYVYLYSFVLVVKPWSLINATYFMQTQNVALTLFGIIAGLTMRFMHRYKYVLLFGLCIRLVGVGLMIHSRGANGSDAELVMTQVLQGFGGGLASISAQVGAQASVPHTDVAMVTAVVLLLTEIGGAVGNACAGAIWSNSMPENLAKYLPELSDEQRKALYGSITDVVKYPRGDPIREGVILAYDDTMKTMILIATVLSVIPILLAFIMPNWYLGDAQNAITETDLMGNYADEDQSSIDSEA
ncbi:MFS general substrate transporter [Coniophora puteana RWD-64-598 SS2]|uniref:MFS general substrate transporter n=1 Tax=Coniophora puteana (strain RWD-64-598) TaxID=741705 RepID=A0A5M3N3I5_CONPW|nr:MFS general substrate transporter [Coniophora puteana RWD-64-598 SS2]EIW85960.1 MFS general substrate transporter [Coniophora puteana RWD-64-598 SS2]